MHSPIIFGKIRNTDVSLDEDIDTLNNTRLNETDLFELLTSANTGVDYCISDTNDHNRQWTFTQNYSLGFDIVKDTDDAIVINVTREQLSKQLANYLEIQNQFIALCQQYVDYQLVSPYAFEWNAVLKDQIDDNEQKRIFDIVSAYYTNIYNTFAVFITQIDEESTAGNVYHTLTRFAETFNYQPDINEFQFIISKHTGDYHY